MTAAGAKIIEGLKDAVAGNFSAVTIEGQRWIRASEWQAIESAPLPAFDAANWFMISFRCLVVGKGGSAKCASYSYTSRGKGRWLDDGGYVTYPTHWMPLPEPPVSA